MTLSSPADLGGCVHEIQKQLSSTFDSPFLVWQRSDTGWIPLSESTHSAQEWIALLFPQLNLWFDALCCEECRTTQCKTIDGCSLVAALTESDVGDPVIIAGRIEVDPLLLASRAATLSLHHAEQEAESNLQQLLVDQYADRLTESYEELTFLRRLSKHVEYCSADRSLSDAAKSTLPQLRELTALEGISLVGALADGDRFLPSHVLQTSGRVPDPDLTCTIVRDIKPSNRRVIVQNYMGELTNKLVSPGEGIRSIVIVPVEKEGTLFGWLIGFNKRTASNLTPTQSPSNFNEIGSIEASLLEAAALMLGSHASNNRLFREKEALVVDVIHTLVGVIEAKDVYTCGHSDRVALMARRLGVELGLSEEECQDIFLSGLLHDIGKIGVADDILLKPGKLTDEEFDQIKLHPERGARLLRGLKPLEKLIPGILHHHEAMDGSGYPHGLVGDAIPQMAMILAVADAFDAMTSNRSYRSGMPVTKAEEILRSGSGKQWNADVVNAYFAARTDIVNISLQWQDHLRRLLDWKSNPSDNSGAHSASWMTDQQWMPMPGALTN